MGSAVTQSDQRPAEIWGRLAKVVLVLLCLLILFLQLRLWFGAGGFSERNTIQEKLSNQAAANAELMERKKQLDSQVNALKNGYDEVEARAREDMGMIKPDETFFMILEDSAD